MKNSQVTAGKGFSLGVLIIGSLFWDCRPIREKWRRTRLDMDHKKYVRVPIRYGRRSVTRGRSFTMVFSTGLHESNFGRAIVVPCKSPDLVNEARHLWDAESNGTGRNGVSARWGRIGVILNPDSNVPPEQIDRWQNLIVGEHFYDHMTSPEGEPVAVSKLGFLNISWPTHEDGSSLEFDALLATATNPNCGHYPSAKMIAEAWSSTEGRKYVCYFWNNWENCIRTFQDDEIKGYLLQHRADA